MRRLCFHSLALLSIVFSIELTKASPGLKSDSFQWNCGRVPNFRSSNKPVTGRITGGKEAIKGEFPWMVAIFDKNRKHSCGGSLLNENYVLTASHCFASYSAEGLTKLSIHIGDFHLKSLSDGYHETRKIQRVLLHKGFDIKTYNNDIALLKLDRPVNYTNSIQPICIPQTETKLHEIDLSGSNVVVAGWGRLTSGLFGLTTNTLRKVEIPIWKYEECKRIFDRFAPGRLTSSQLCAGDGRKNKDACTGDSGGPLMWKSTDSLWYQVGIVSWGKGCGSFPGVYTDIRKYTNWIVKNMQ